MTSFVVDQMTWSYSRLKAFEDCPYGFFLRYIYHCQQTRTFFADYGSFVHSILADIYLGKITADDACAIYASEFAQRVVNDAPSPSTYLNYFNAGLDAVKHPRMPSGKILGVERKVKFKVGQYDFVGIIDLVVEANDGSIEIWDHKSKALKPRTKRLKQSVQDMVLDEYLRQLYLYSIPVIEIYGRKPKTLVFNCYRTGTVIREPFDPVKLGEAKNWATSTIEKVRACEKYLPSADYFKCRYICSMRDECEFA